MAEPVAAVVQRFRPYPEYRRSRGVWLRSAPSGWSETTVRRVFFVVNGATPKSDNSDFWDGDVPWITPEDLGALHGAEIHGSARRLTSAGYKSCGTTLVPTGSLVVSTRAPIGHLGVAARPLCTNQGCRSLVLRRPGVPRFYYFLFHALRPELESWGEGSTFRELSSTKLKDLRVPLPSVPEQQAIAAFLDRETAKIDALVVKHERLIGLTQTRLHAKTAHVVQRGIDGTARYAASDVPWMETIPSHWRVMRLRYLATCLDSRRIPLNATERATMRGDVPYWGSGGIVGAVDRHLFDEELVLLGEDGAPFFDSARPVAYRVTGRTWINNHIHVLRPASGMDARYLAACLNCVDYRVFIDGTTRDKLTQEDMKQIPLPVPPREEQLRIADVFDVLRARQAHVEGALQAAMDRLNEYRSALITAAVTGQIDVRGEVAA